MNWPANSFVIRLASQGRREQIAREIANFHAEKAARILALPLFAVAESGKGGMDSEYAKARRLARKAA